MLKINLLRTLLEFSYKALIISTLHEYLGCYTDNHKKNLY
jgi:hypothetical protein